MSPAIGRMSRWLLGGALIAAAAPGVSAGPNDPALWSGQPAGGALRIYTDGQRAIGGLRGDGLDVTLVGTLQKNGEYRGSVSGGRPQRVEGSWHANLSGAARDMVVSISKIDRKPQPKEMRVSLTGPGAPPALRCGWTRGRVTLERRRATSTLDPGDGLAIGDEITTAAESAAILVLKDRSVAVLQERTTLVLPASQFNSGDDIQRVKVRSGRIWFAVRKLGSGERFEVQTEGAVAAVRGTEFVVGAEPQDFMSLTTAEGKVEALDETGQKDPLLVNEGRSWRGRTRAGARKAEWPGTGKADLLDLVDEWRPLLALTDVCWPQRRAGKPQPFWQDQSDRPDGNQGPGGRRVNRGGNGNDDRDWLALGFLAAGLFDHHRKRPDGRPGGGNGQDAGGHPPNPGDPGDPGGNPNPGPPGRPPGGNPPGLNGLPNPGGPTGNNVGPTTGGGKKNPDGGPGGRKERDRNRNRDRDRGMGNHLGGFGNRDRGQGGGGGGGNHDRARGGQGGLGNLLGGGRGGR